MKIVLILLLCSFSLSASIAKIYALKGSAHIKRASTNITLKLGDSLKEKDRIITAKQTQIQIIFNDRTIVTLGDTSDFEIVNYVFDTKANSKANFRLKKGVLKSMTGTIGKWSPKDFIIKTSTAKIGVNGTTLLLKVTDKQTTLATLSGETTFTNNRSQKKLTIGQNKQLTQNNQSRRVHITTIQSSDIQMDDHSNQKTSNKQNSNKENQNNQSNGNIQSPINAANIVEDNLAGFATTTLNKKRVIVNHDTHYSYGYWDAGGIAATPFSEGDAVSSSVVGTYNALASYSGNVVSIHNGVASTVGNINMQIDFTTNGIPSGNMNITDSSNETWYVNFNATNVVSGNGFNLNSAHITDGGGTSTYTSGSLNGTFFGNGNGNPIQNQDGISGTFNLNGTNAGQAVSVDGAYGAINTGVTPQ